MSALTAIGSSSPASQSASSKPALRAQLSRYEKERSDCVNCSSAKTTEGQQNIRQLDAMIKTLQEQLGTIRQANVPVLQSDPGGITFTSTASRIDVYA